MSLEARFRISRGDFVLDVQLTTPDQGVTAIHGPSGCGKTTLLRAIAGLEVDPAGFLEIGGRVWQDRQTYLPPHQRPIGFVFQEASLFPHLSVRGNLAYGFKRVPASERRTDFDEVVRLLAVADLLDRSVADLSGGERQRTAIAQALLTSPRLLLLDEPLTGLDTAGKAEILPYLERLHSELEMPVLYVSHAADEVARLADHLVLMLEGTILGSGTIAEMRTRFDLPLSRAADAEALVEAEVVRQDESFHLTELSFHGGRVLVAREELEIGTPVRLRVLARDVSLTLERQTDTSILNILPVTVAELATDGPARMLVKLSAGDTLLLSRITRKSAEALHLEVGQALFAQIKTVALLA